MKNIQECTESYFSQTKIKQDLTAKKAIRKNRLPVGRAERSAEDLSGLALALESEIWEREILQEQLIFVKAQEKVALHAAFHDPLTGLPNRALFNDRLEHGLEQAKRHGWALAVMFLDLDAFKAINDTYGHDVGDSVLHTISTRLKANTRSDDTVCRYGGDEFLFLLMEVKNKQAVTLIAQSLVKIIQQPCFVSLCNSAIRLSINSSIGISMYPQDGETADDLIKSADKAMYKSKKTKCSYSFAVQAN